MKQNDPFILEFYVKAEVPAAKTLPDLWQDAFPIDIGVPSQVSDAGGLSPEEIRTAIYSEAEPLIRAVSESIQNAQNSNVIDTRKFEIASARAKIIELQRVKVRHPSLQLPGLKEAKLLIAQIEQETIALRYQGTTERGQDGQELERQGTNERDQDGQDLEKQGKFAEAIVAYENLVKRVPDSPFVYKRLAVLHQMLNSTENEIRVLTDALKNVSESSKEHRKWFKARLNKIKTRENASS